MKEISSTLLVMIFSSLFFCLAASAQDQSSANFHISSFQFELIDGRTVEAERGTLLVPENRKVSDSRLIPINFVRLSSTSENPESPIFYLAPGPGGSGIQAARSNYAFFAMLREISDVIVFDQRGTGETDLSCPERVFLPIDRSLPYEEVLSVFIWELQRCKEYWEVQGIDLKGYTTIESAHDVNKLRAKLGINKISLVGSSYGSHYALTILKYYGNTIDRVVITGIE